jgi:hypothetical protein
MAYDELNSMGMNEYGESHPFSAAARGELIGLASLARYNPFGIEEGFLSILVKAGVLSDSADKDLLPESQQNT